MVFLKYRYDDLTLYFKSSSGTTLPTKAVHNLDLQRWEGKLQQTIHLGDLLFASAEKANIHVAYLTTKASGPGTNTNNFSNSSEIWF